jgi:hypothetical protein
MQILPLQENTMIANIVTATHMDIITPAVSRKFAVIPSSWNFPGAIDESLLGVAAVGR